MTDDECGSCGEDGTDINECPKSKRPCGHHCNCSWTQDVCHWCGATFDEPINSDTQGSPMLTFSAVIAPALAGTHVRMESWHNKFHLEVDRTYSIPILLRVHDDGSYRAPWGSVTEADMFGSWVTDDGTAVPDPAFGSFGWALDKIDAGHIIRQDTWPAGMSLEPHFDSVTGKCIRLAFPHHKRAIWRPAPQDLVATYCEVVTPAAG